MTGAERSRRYRERHSDRVRKSQRGFHERNPDKAREYQERFRERNPDSERSRQLKRKYGMSSEEYDQLLEDQGGVCAICGSECPTGRRLAADHDHETGCIRGLLCSRCNPGVGMFQNDPELLRRAAEYLEDSPVAPAARQRGLAGSVTAQALPRER